MKKLIALIGFFGSGKTTAAKYFEKLEAEIILADEIGHELLTKSKIQEAIRDIFDNTVFVKNEISREKLGNLVFSDKLFYGFFCLIYRFFYPFANTATISFAVIFKHGLIYNIFMPQDLILYYARRRMLCSTD